ncbi:MAG: thiamine-phosphate kinase [Xanthomonadales bacterium]|nr:thiamine-phosphate kinase [Xanthomonadales bacterium]
MSEFELIARLRRRLGATGADRLEVGNGDDAAVWRPGHGMHVVACCDTLVEGRHFPVGTSPFDLGWKALAVNLSDLAAMAARPAVALLALTLPADPGADWIEDFCAGWEVLAQPHRLALAGGDLTRGPVLTVTVTCLGELPPGAALRRAGAAAGDAIFVSGTLGDAAAALALWDRRGEPELTPLMARLTRPTPRLALGRALRGVASAAIDVSDGLVADLGHLLDASGVGARIDADAVPCGELATALLGATQARTLALAGGDDYELCFTVPADRIDAAAAAAAAAGTPVARIGTVESGAGLAVVDRNGRPVPLARAGWDHFRS